MFTVNYDKLKRQLESALEHIADYNFQGDFITFTFYAVDEHTQRLAKVEVVINSPISSLRTS